jgi:4,5-dihydroxyphthalate decarboxylase
MANLQLTLACGDYDRTHAVVAGLVQPEGVEFECLSDNTRELFRRMLHAAEFDVSELSLSNYVTGLSRGDRRFVAIPVFPFRAFRQSMVWVRADAGIREPRDLVGKRFGVPEYAVTALLFLRGFLQHDYGVQPEDVRWYRAWPDRVSLELPPGVQLADLPPGQSLPALLQAGELDAIAPFSVPWDYAPIPEGVARLFPDVRAVEVDYYRRTGIFPIMHLITIRRELYEEHRWLARSLAEAFQAAKDHCYAGLRASTPNYSLTPWQRLDIAETWHAFGGDPYPNGVAANRPTMEAAVRFSHEQGLSARPVAVEELFAPEAVEYFEK